MDGRRVKFKIDTGADVTVIPDKVFNQIYGNNAPKFAEATKIICGPECVPLDV